MITTPLLLSLLHLQSLLPIVIIPSTSQHALMSPICFFVVVFKSFLDLVCPRSQYLIAMPGIIPSFLTNLSTHFSTSIAPIYSSIHLSMTSAFTDPKWPLLPRLLISSICLNQCLVLIWLDVFPAFNMADHSFPKTLHLLASETFYSLSSLQMLDHWRLGIGLFSSLSSVYS